MIPRILLLACLASAAFPACGGGTSIRTMGNAAAMDDATITARVKTALLNDTQIAATKIDVTTTNGVVTISGTVRNRADEQRAIELARQQPGVKDVKSTLQLGS
jgi:hyperosmotically inducible protein